MEAVGGFENRRALQGGILFAFFSQKKALGCGGLQAFPKAGTSADQSAAAQKILHIPSPPFHSKVHTDLFYHLLCVLAIKNFRFFETEVFIKNSGQG
jgi:hypothetical protein